LLYKYVSHITDEICNQNYYKRYLQTNASINTEADNIG